MREKLQRHGAFALALLMVLAVCLLFAQRKNGMFIDEIYTYGLSNSHYAPFLKDVAGGELEGAVLTRQELLDYVTVGEDEIGDFGSVYDNQVNDVHPPLYYWLFHLVSCLTPGVFSKWTGLGLDLILYLLSLFALYRLVLRLFGSPWNAAAAVLLYGLSGLGLSTMLMIRMYVLMTALTVQLALLVVLQMKRPRRLWPPLIGLTIFLGLMTQYYFVFYAFFLCAFYVFWAAGKKRWKDLGLFALFALAGAALLLLCFPACLNQLLAATDPTVEKLGHDSNLRENLLNFSRHGPLLERMTRHLRLKGLRAARLASYPLLLLLLPCLPRLRTAVGKRPLSVGPWLTVLVPALLVYPLVTVISPVPSVRYLYNIIPILVLLPCLLLHLLERSLEGLPRPLLWKSAALALLLVLGLWEARTYPPQDYLYPEHSAYNALLDEHAEAPCVYLTGHFEPLTQDLIQLLRFDEVYITEDPAAPALKERTAGARECVVFIDTSAYWSSGFDPQVMLPALMEETGFTGVQPLYSYELSETYLLTK